MWLWGCHKDRASFALLAAAGVAGRRDTNPIANAIGSSCAIWHDWEQKQG